MSCMTADHADPPPGDDLDRSVSGVLRSRGLVIGVLVTVFLALPAVSLFTKHGLSGDAAFLVPGTVVFVVLVDRWVLTSQPSYLRPGDMVILGTIVVLGAALFAVGQMNWLTARPWPRRAPAGSRLPVRERPWGWRRARPWGWRSACGTTSATAPCWRRSACRCWAACSPTVRSGVTS
jgi:hypothetical protein